MIKKILFILIIMIITLGVLIFQILEKDTNKENNINSRDISIINTTTEEVDIEKVKKVKDEIKATAEENIYEIHKEYDGREILSIKPTVQFKTVLAGILKNDKPTEEEAEHVNFSIFHKNGVWISERSRNIFLNILYECGLKNFQIDEEGYLKKVSNYDSEYSSQLEKMINSNELIIIDISGRSYIRDEMTGEIVEYPFKDMDLYQISELYEIKGSKIIIITTNEVNKNDILKEICNQSKYN